MKRIFLCTVILCFIFSTYACKQRVDTEDTYVPRPASSKVDASADKNQAEDTIEKPTEKDEVAADPVYEQSTLETITPSDSDDKQQGNNTDTPISFKTDIKKVGFEGLPYGGPIEVKPYRDDGTLDEFFEKAPEGRIIVSGIKKEQSTQYITKVGATYDNWYSETPIEITAVYAGDARVGDSITVFEKAVVIEWEGKNSIMRFEDIPVIEKGKEYIFILSKYDYYCTSEKTVYSIYKKGFEITDKIKGSASADEAGLTGFKKEVFDTYYYK